MQAGVHVLEFFFSSSLKATEPIRFNQIRVPFQFELDLGHLGLIFLCLVKIPPDGP